MRPTLLLLHGAIGAADQLLPLADALKDNYDVHCLNFSGHGGSAIPESGFSMPAFADDVLAYMDKEQLQQVSIFGYSMGGYVAMYLAKHHPDRVQKVATLATKYHWDEAIAAKETQMLNAEKIEVKLPAFATALQNRHAPTDWKTLLAKTAEMMLGLGADNTLKPGDYVDIQHPCLVLLGDRDKMITLEETITVYKELPNAQMAMLPATGHPIEQVDVDTLSFLLRKFFN